MTDADLLRRVQQGDSSAWAALYQRYLPTVWRYVYMQSDGNQHVCEDVVSETILALVRGIGTLDPADCNLSGWLISVARHKLADHRRRTVRADRLAESAQRVEAAGESGTDPTRPLEASETRARVVAVMERLPDEERLLLEWKYLEDMSVREIADRIGRTEKAVESILYRARRSFQSLFERRQNFGL